MSSRIIPPLSYTDTVHCLNRHKLLRKKARTRLIERIKQSPLHAYLYAYEVIEGRWPEGEPAVLRDPEWVYLYARHVIKGRWPEGEPTILQDTYYTYLYALIVIKDRWPEGEARIIQDPSLGPHYLGFFADKPVRSAA